MRLTWDARKASSNLRKHRISFDEAATVLADALGITILDPEHSFGEHRFVTIGVSSSQRLLVVCHTHDEDTARIISARRPTAYERKQYEDKEGP